MKKVLSLLVLLTVCLSTLKAQNDTVIIFSPDAYHVDICFNKYQRIILYAPDGCDSFHWEIEDENVGDDNPIILDGYLRTVWIRLKGIQR